jgi:predicted NAD/FAD-binding protein
MNILNVLTFAYSLELLAVGAAPDMRIAVIGGGISGLSAAWMLSQQHEVTVFEAERQPGGHSRTIQFRLDDRDYSIDVGFIVWNDRTYPLFMELLRLLDVAGAPTYSSPLRSHRT